MSRFTEGLVEDQAGKADWALSIAVMASVVEAEEPW